MTNVEEAMVALTQKPLKSMSFQRIKLLGDIKRMCGTIATARFLKGNALSSGKRRHAGLR